MNTSVTMDEINQSEIENLGIQLSLLRQQRGYSIDYIANKLHLRTRIIELIERSDFKSLPEPVFIKGYLRAYAKLLGVSPDPFLVLFNNHYAFENKSEKTLWQSSRQTHKAEYAIRLFTIIFALGVMIAVGVWWQKNRATQQDFLQKDSVVAPDFSLNQTHSELNVADLSSLQSLLTPETQMSLMEKQDV